MQIRVQTATSLVLASLVALAGCHASEDDPGGLAKELGDPVRREHAAFHIQRLYSGALAQAKGDRSALAVKAVTDAAVADVTAAYTAHREDSQNGLLMIRILADMRDVRALPAFLAALDWRAEVNEEHAVTAAETLKELPIADADRGKVIDALGAALDRVAGTRGKDAQMRHAFIQALGALGDKRAAPTLTKVMLSENEAQNFVFNILAAQKLARIADETAVPALVKALFLYPAGKPNMRMNDVASGALVRIGRPALAALLDVLGGKNEDANNIAKRYIEEVRRLDPNAAAAMSVEMLTGAEATFALGALGLPDAYGALFAEAKGAADISRRMNAAIALVRLNLSDAQRAEVRAVLQDIHAKSEDPAARAQLLAVMRHTYDAAFLPTFMATLKDVEKQHEAVRLAAAEAYALLANKAEAEELKAYLRTVSEEKEPYREDMERTHGPALAAAAECDVDLACWVKGLAGGDAAKVRKSIYMAGRLGAGNAEAVKALVGLLGKPQAEVRLAAVQALDRIATQGSPEAVARITELEKVEEGRKIWKDFAREALPIQARLLHRAAK